MNEPVFLIRRLRHIRGARVLAGLLPRIRWQGFQLRRGLAAIGLGFGSLAVRQATLPVGLAGLAMLIKELRGMLMQPGRLVVNGGRMLMRCCPPALLLVLAIRFAHNSRLSLS